jgi:hypothetical protein
MDIMCLQAAAIYRYRHCSNSTEPVKSAQNTFVCIYFKLLFLSGNTWIKWLDEIQKDRNNFQCDFICGDSFLSFDNEAIHQLIDYHKYNKVIYSVYKNNVSSKIFKITAIDQFTIFKTKSTMSKLTRTLVICISLALIVLFLIDIDYQNFFSKSNRTEIIGILIMFACISSMVLKFKQDTKKEP